MFTLALVIYGALGLYQVMVIPFMLIVISNRLEGRRILAGTIYLLTLVVLWAYVIPYLEGTYYPNLSVRASWILFSLVTIGLPAGTAMCLSLSMGRKEATARLKDHENGGA